MKSLKERISKLEDESPVREEPEFIGWIGAPWTEEQKAMMIRKYPEIKLFQKPLTNRLPCEVERMSERDQEFERDMASLVTSDEEKMRRSDGRPF